MVLKDSIVSKFQAYIIYSKSLKEIARRIVNYMNGCNNIISDVELKPIFDELCTESKPQFIEIKDENIVDKIVSEAELNKGVVFRVESPRDDVYAIAFIPVNQRNKEVAQKR
jgi:hypothetical protein